MKTIQKNLVWTLLIVLAVFSSSSILAQPLCKNALTNPMANKGTLGWTVHGSAASIATLAGGNKSFKVRDNDSHFYQDVAIPKGTKVVHISGYTRNSQASATTGHAYLYAYIMDGSGTILEYVQFGVNNTGMIWTLDRKKVLVGPKAKSVRLFLKRSSIKGETDTNNNAHFDNLSVTFGCPRVLPQPPQY